MIPNLEHKANNEKYFKSIRYFSHSLKGEKRRYFISLVAEYNIYLAAQCIMSAEKDEELESSLIQKATIIAENFSQPINSANGFLALAEFESLKTIISLFSNIEKPNNTHLQVIAKIFENIHPEIFCSFLNLFTKTDKTQLIVFAMNTYNGELPLNNEIKEHLKRFFKYLLDKKLFGLLAIFIEKYNLYIDFSFILNDKPENIIRQISDQSFKGTKFGLKLAEKNGLILLFKPDYFLNNAIKQAQNKKALIFALKIANRYGLKNQKQLNDVLEKKLNSSDKTARKHLNPIGKNALLNYFSENPKLSNRVSQFFDAQSMRNEIVNKRKIKATIDKLNIAEEKSFISIKNVIDEKKVTLDEILQLYFFKYQRIPLDMVLEEVLANYDTNFLEVSHKLRYYETQGFVKYLMDYGCYVKPQQFKTEKLLFLHKNQITDKQDLSHPNELLIEGDLIKFRIIGINRQNHRLNISCLDRFNPEDI